MLFPEAAAAAGLAPGTPVAGSCYDVNACALASGILDDDTLCMIAGTWSINEVLSKDLVDGANSIAESYKPGYYIMEESSPTSAGNLEWFIEKLMEPDRKGIKKQILYDECNKMAEKIGAEDSGVIFCDMLQMPLEVSEALEPGALGAAMCAAVAGGVYRDIDEAVKHMVHMKKTYLPNPEKRKIYEKKFAAYKQALAALDFFCEGGGTVC